MAELEWRRRQEQHPLEPAVERAREQIGVLACLVAHEQRGELGGRVLDVVGLVEDEKWENESGRR